MSLLLVLPWLIPLLAAAVTAARWAWWLPAVAALPGVLSAVLLTDGAQLELPWLLLGTSLGSDPIARLFLAFTSVLWLAAGIYAAPLMRDGPHAARFRVFFLLAMTGNLLLILGQDLVSFYLGFSLVGLAAYGLVVHDGDPAALRAGRVYLAMTLAGELALFAALVMIAQHAGSLTPERDQLVGLGDLTVGLLIFGLAIKAGLVPLHVWLPLAHPAAPVPASAVLSGAMIKVALLGWLRFLPVGEESLAGWGLLLVFAGMLSLFFAVPIGLIQSNPKVILAYSSVSKMGLLSLTLGLMLVEPALAPAGILALTLYAAHHALVKGGLFLGVGLRLHGPLQAVVLVGLVLLALSMAGMPPTSGAVAKYAMKPTLTGTDWAWLTQAVALSAAATALLMARFLWVVWRLPAHPEPGYGAGTLAWGALIVLSIAYALMLGTPAAWLSDARPVGIGLALAAAVALVAWLKPARLSPLIDRVPPGDLIALAGPLLAVGEFTIQTGARQWRRARRFLISRGADAVTALRARAGDPETAMATWPAAGAAWLGVLVLLLALGFAVQPFQVPPETAGPIETEAVDRETGDVDLVGGEAAEPTAPGPTSDVEEAPPQDRAPVLAHQDRDARSPHRSPRSSWRTPNRQTHYRRTSGPWVRRPLIPSWANLPRRSTRRTTPCRTPPSGWMCDHPMTRGRWRAIRLPPWPMHRRPRRPRASPWRPRALRARSPWRHPRRPYPAIQRRRSSSLTRPLPRPCPSRTAGLDPRAPSGSPPPRSPTTSSDSPSCTCATWGSTPGRWTA